MAILLAGNTPLSSSLLGSSLLGHLHLRLAVRCRDVSIWLRGHLHLSLSFRSWGISISGSNGISTGGSGMRCVAVVGQGASNYECRLCRAAFPCYKRLSSQSDQTGRVSSYNFNRLHSPCGSTSSSILSARPSRRRGGRHRYHSNIHILEFESIARHRGAQSL